MTLAARQRLWQGYCRMARVHQPAGLPAQGSRVCDKYFPMMRRLFDAVVHPRVSYEREREREIHNVHSASLAYEDGIVFMSEPSAARQ